MLRVIESQAFKNNVLQDKNGGRPNEKILTKNVFSSNFVRSNTHLSLMKTSS